MAVSFVPDRYVHLCVCTLICTLKVIMNSILLANYHTRLIIALPSHYTSHSDISLA